jgi:polysaccharide pyruvyl transferase WcaK-like protein
VTDGRTWPPGSPRLLVTDAWLANAGDAAIALATDRLLRELAPGAAVVHASYHHERVGPLLPALSFVPPLEVLLGVPGPPVPRWRETGPALVDGADLVICQGGGFLVEAYEPLGRVLALAAVVERGLRLAFLGVTVDRFDRSVYRVPLQRALRGAELVVVRDPASVAHAVDCDAGEVVLGTDLVVGMFGERPRGAEGEGIGVVLTDHHPHADRRCARVVAARHLLAEVVRHGAGEPITLWSTVQGAADLADQDDGAFAQGLLAELPEAARERIGQHRTLMGPSQAIELVRASRAVVTMRMHPALFAAGADVPFALVLDGQRTGVFAGTSLTDAIAPPGDEGAVSALVERTLTAPSPSPWVALAPLRARYEVMRDRLAPLVTA